MNLFKRLFCKNKENGFKYVDLGLPSGTMWATCNVGASRPEDEGLLFQFGRVDGYRYNDSSNQFRTNAQNKQDTGNEYIPKTASGKVYNIGDALDLADDAAHVNMGGKWRMPTRDELEELIINTTHDVVTVNSVQGIMFTSSINTNQLFIPFAQGYWDRHNRSWFMAGTHACLWSSQVHYSYNDFGNLLFCSYYGSVNLSDDIRSYAFSVRGVFSV